MVGVVSLDTRDGEWVWSQLLLYSGSVYFLWSSFVFFRNCGFHFCPNHTPHFMCKIICLLRMKKAKNNHMKYTDN